MIFYFPSAKHLVREGKEIITKVFPDGESYVRLPEVEKEVVIFQNFYPEQDKRIIELVLAIETFKELGAEKITCIIPYFAYSRQDRRFLENEAISLKVILKHLRDAGCSKVVTVDVHKPEAFKIEGMECINIEPFDLYSKFIEDNIGDCFLVSPDFGSLWRVKKIAEKLKVEYDYFEKERDRITGKIKIKEKEMDVKNKKVVVIDDIISTGGTMYEVCNILKKQGAKEIYVIVTHHLGMQQAEKINEIAKVVSTNTILTKYSVIDISPLIYNYI